MVLKTHKKSEKAPPPSPSPVYPLKAPHSIPLPNSSKADYSTKDQTTKHQAHRLEDQPWYHGVLPREEIKQNLQKEGQFLVRTSTKAKSLSIVISVKWKGQLQHFQVGRDVEGWKLEGSGFPSVAELVEYHIREKKPVTKASGAKLQIPVKRNAWLLDNRDIAVEKVLGAGQFGEVCLGKWNDPESPEPRCVAIKKCTRTGPLSDNEKKAFLKEAKLMLSYKHKNVIRIFGVACDKPPIMIVMELCENGSLDKYLKKHNTTTQQKLNMAIDAAKGMEYLATRPLPCVHRDLAARNCLLGSRNEVKISDFGMSREGSYAMASRKGKQVPIRWTAPEALEKGVFNTETDVYSFGVLMWEIYSDGKIPWHDEQNAKVVYKSVKNGVQMDCPAGCPREVYRIMQDCWNLTPSLRPTFTVIRRRLEALDPNHGQKTQMTQKSDFADDSSSSYK